jgi:hypothetical protein
MVGQAVPPASPNTDAVLPARARSSVGFPQLYFFTASLISSHVGIAIFAPLPRAKSFADADVTVAPIVKPGRLRVRVPGNALRELDAPEIWRC